MKKSGERWTVGILVFEEVEVLDFTGPFEVFSITTTDNEIDSSPFVVKTISEFKKVITARNGLKILPDYDFANSPRFDILIIPGGPGARNVEFSNDVLLNWIRDQYRSSLITASVCTGGLLLAKTGLLDGKRATTHWRSYDFLENEFPEISVIRNVKYVDEGNILTSGGISSGINMSLHIVERMLGPEAVLRTAHRMEFDFIPSS